MNGDEGTTNGEFWNWCKCGSGEGYEEAHKTGPEKKNFCWGPEGFGFVGGKKARGEVFKRDHNNNRRKGRVKGR